MKFTFDELLKVGYIDAMVVAYFNVDDAANVLLQAGVPAHQISFGARNAVTFWNEAVAALCAGTGGDPVKVLDLAIRYRPNNELLVKLPLRLAELARPATRVLFVTANPLTTQHLRIDREWEIVKQWLDPLTRTGRLVLHDSFATQWPKLEGKIDVVRPGVVHFSVHGEDDGTLLFDDGNGGHEGVSPDELGDLFERINHPVPVVRVVVLNGCQTARAVRRLRAHVPVVVGYRGETEDAAALAFAGGFYKVGATERPLRDAITSGRNAIDKVKIDPALLAVGQPPTRANRPTGYNSRQIVMKAWENELNIKLFK